MLSSKRYNPADNRTDVIARVALAVVAVLAAVVLQSGTGIAFFFLIFLLDTRQPDVRRNALVVGFVYALSVLLAPLMPFANPVSVVLLFSALNIPVGLSAYTHSRNKPAMLVFIVANIMLAGVALLLGLNEVSMSPGRIGFLYLLMFFILFAVSNRHATKKDDSAR